MSRPVSSRTSRFRARLRDSFLLTLPPGNVQSLCPTTCRTSKTEPLSSSIHAITETSFFGLNPARFFFPIRKGFSDATRNRPPSCGRKILFLDFRVQRASGEPDSLDLTEDRGLRGSKDVRAYRRRNLLPPGKDTYSFRRDGFSGSKSRSFSPHNGMRHCYEYE